MEYEAVVGMEVHAQIGTASKMFCGCSADTNAPPNTHVCPVCLGMPGSLPVINETAVEATLRTGLALHCTIPHEAKFDRKNYHYPDLPKGYQISQYEQPFCLAGYLDVPSNGGTKRIRVRRVHLEEDTGRLQHVGQHSLVDYNRAGVPLMEIVTEADLSSADEVWHYLTRLRSILRYLGVSSGNMEEGAMRCEANVSVRPIGSDTLGEKVEVKNLNSFRSVRLAIAYEIERQCELLERGDRVQQVTVGWDEEHHRTVFQRSKEYAEDYRYFPEPDLPPLTIATARVDALRAALPELPEAKAQRFIADYGIKPDDVALLVEDREVAAFFEATVRAASDVEPQVVANWTVGEVFRLLSESDTSIADTSMTAEQLAALLQLLAQDAINANGAKEVLGEMFAQGGDPNEIVEARGLRQISGASQLAEIVADVLASHPEPVADYRAGKEAALGFLMGQVMRATRGKANPKVARAMLTAALDQGQRDQS